MLFEQNPNFILQLKRNPDNKECYIENPFATNNQEKQVYVKNYNLLFEQEYHFLQYFEVIALYAKEGHVKIIKKLQELSDNNYEIYLQLLHKNDIE